MSLTEMMVRKLCNTLVSSLVYNTALHYRFGLWLRSPLPRNEYAHLIADRMPPARPTIAVRPKERAPIAATAASAVQQPAGVRKINVLSKNELPNKRSFETARVDVHAKRKGDSDGFAGSITNDLHTSMASVGAALTEERQLTLRVMEDAAERYFGFAQAGIIPKITQLILVLVLEPVNLSLEFVLRKRFSEDFVVRNFLSKSSDTLTTDDVGAWNRDVSRMTFNFFSRFPELAVNCDDTCSVEELRAIQHLWCIADEVFDKCVSTQHSESAREFRYNTTLETILYNRAPLLEAVARANIYAGGTDHGHFALRRDIFVDAFVCAHLHVLDLHAKSTDASGAKRKLQNASAALRKATNTIRQYQLSAL